MKSVKLLLAIVSIFFSSVILASTSIPMYMVAKKGHGANIGTVTISETRYGLLFTPNLHGLTPGLHGFHIHANPSCDNNGMAAGGHFIGAGRIDEHDGPYSQKGHIGDLPPIYVNKNGIASLPVLAPNLKLISQITNHALMVHVFGDNYSDKPEKLGGGGARMACGIIKKG